MDRGHREGDPVLGGQESNSTIDSESVAWWCVETTSRELEGVQEIDRKRRSCTQGVLTRLA